MLEGEDKDENDNVGVVEVELAWEFDLFFKKSKPKMICKRE